MSENKFIAKLKGVKSAKSVVEVQDPKAKKSFTGIAGTSDSPQGYSLDTASSVVVANGAKNWTCGYGTLTQSADYRGDGSDYTGSWNADGAGLWMNATYTFPASDDPSNSTVAIINPNAKWVLTLFGAGLLSDGANVVKLKLVVQIGAKNIASKDFVLPVHAFQFCEQLAVDFTESTTEQIKVDGGTQLNVQLLCEDENAHAQIFSGMTVLTLLDRKIDARDVASDKTSFDDLEKRIATNAQAIDVIESKIPDNASPTNKMATAAEISNLQTQITSNDTDISNLQNSKADKATDFETPITKTNKGATMKEIEEVQTTSIKFKGYVSTTQPASDAYLLVEGNMWINAATMPSSFPVPASSIRVWDGSAWQTTTESYTPDALDAWSNLNNNEGYYWFGAWKVFSTDLSTEYFTLNQTSGLWEIKQSIHLPGTPTVDTPDGTNPQAIVNVDYVNTMGTIDNKITNCVLEIPQNLNLELNNGTLTLKAGSKTYMPRAGGGFDELVTTKDITYTHPVDGEYLLFIESQGRWLSIMETKYCFSGTTEPEKTGYKVWYDTGTNIINYYNSDNVATKQSFPIAKVTVSGGQISSIDAVFNGFGFIGGSIFSFPGLKVAVPNGRNPDGTLNNLTTEQTRVVTTILSNSTRTKLWANANGIIAVNDETTSDYGYTYDERLNIVYSKNNMQRRKYAHIADLVLASDDNLHIIDINPKYPIRVTDYWDFNKLLKEYATGFAKTDLSNVSAEGIDTAVGWGMPDYSAGISGSNLLQNFTCDRDYLFIFVAYRSETGVGTLIITIDNHNVHTLGVKEQESKHLPLYIRKGSIVTTSTYAGASVQASHTRFPLLKGA